MSTTSSSLSDYTNDSTKSVDTEGIFDFEDIENEIAEIDNPYVQHAKKLKENKEKRDKVDEEKERSRIREEEQNYEKKIKKRKNMEKIVSFYKNDKEKSGYSVEDYNYAVAWLDKYPSPPIPYGAIDMPQSNADRIRNTSPYTIPSLYNLPDFKQGIGGKKSKKSKKSKKQRKTRKKSKK